MPTTSKINYTLTGRQIAAGAKPMVMTGDEAIDKIDELPGLGIHGMDSALTGPATNSGAAPIEFLRSVLPGIVRVMTTVRAIDRIAGIQEAGNWYDEEVAKKVLQHVGKAELYGDSTNIPLANYKHGYEFRSVVRFESGYESKKLEEAREAAAGINMSAEKRASAVLSLEIARQRLGMFGMAGGTTRTFGLLNDPGLLPYETVTGVWSGKTFDEIVTDLSDWFETLLQQGAGHIDMNTNFVLVLPLGAQSALTRPNTLGMTVRKWLQDNYPNTRIEFAPEFVGANGGANVAYLMAEGVEVGGDSGEAVIQVVPAKLFNVGNEQRAKSYIEDFANATAGVMVQYPWMIVRASGL